jgi:drug/metabolite transporter (DMT)-like permease
MIVGGGVLWAATTLVVKTTPLLRAPPEKALAYQVALSIPILGLAAWLSGESLTRVPGPLALSLMVYQAFWVVGLTFLLWFALVKTYSASKLSAFTFITPLFGVVASYFILHDTLTLAFGAAALLVIAGLYLVNRPDPVVPVPTDPLLSVTKTRYSRPHEPARKTASERRRRPQCPAQNHPGHGRQCRRRRRRSDCRAVDDQY